MAAVIGKYAANKLLGKQMDKYKHQQVESGADPYFAMIPVRSSYSPSVDLC